jgi:geranylgeranyl reductase
MQAFGDSKDQKFTLTVYTAAMQVESYDVVIVGAGPGGLSCARALSGSGQRVLVLEKSDSLGKKICAGELTAKVLPDEIFDRGRPWTEIHVGNDRTSHALKLPRPFAWTAGRHTVESHLMKGCDAEIRFNEPVQRITPEFVETRTGRFHYKHLVGADGAGSIVRRNLGLPRESIVGWAYHFVVDRPADEFHIYWLPRTFPAGYGYMMSRSRGQTMVGIAFEGDRFDRDVAKRAGEWVARTFGLDVSALRHEAAKGNADYRGWRFGNVFLVGEAAGLLNPLSTEGIYYAIRSGEGVGRFLRGDAGGETLLRHLERVHNKQVRIFKLVTNKNLPFCWMVDWVMADPRKGLRRWLLHRVLYWLMDRSG